MAGDICCELRRHTTSRKGTAKKAKAPSGPKSGGERKRGKGTDVERNWTGYLKQRKLLERAVETVRAAEEDLRVAREEERRLRQEFDEAKATLERLLEVAPASEAGGPPVALDLPTAPPLLIPDDDGGSLDLD